MNIGKTHEDFPNYALKHACFESTAESSRNEIEASYNRLRFRDQARSLLLLATSKEVRGPLLLFIYLEFGFESINHRSILQEQHLSLAVRLMRNMDSYSGSSRTAGSRSSRREDEERQKLTDYWWGLEATVTCRVAATAHSTCHSTDFFFFGYWGLDESKTKNSPTTGNTFPQYIPATFRR